MKPKFIRSILKSSSLIRPSLAACAAICTTGIAWSQTDGVWTSDASGNWSDGLNWDAGAIAESGGTADFSTIDILAGTLTVTVDGAYDVSAMSFGDTDTATAGTWSLALGGNLTLSGGRTVTTAVTTAFTGAFGTQAATDILDKQGAGQLNLTGLTAAWPGPLNLGEGTVRFRDNTSSKSTVAGALTGTGTVLVSQGATRTFTQESDISAFTGKISCASGNFRYANGSGNPTAEQANGSQVTFDFGAGGNVINRNGTSGTITIRLGELIGSTGSFLSGGNAAGTGQVLFQVGEKGVDSIFGGGVRDGLTKSALTKSGAAKLTLSGSNTFTGATNIDGGILEVSSTGEITASASLTIQGAGSYTFSNNGGSTAFTGNVALANSNFSPLVKVVDGLFTAGSMSIGRGGAGLATEPAQGSTTAGFYVSGTSDIDITSGISINGSNSSGSARFDGGTVDVGGVVTIGLGNTGRWSVLDVNGATFTSTDTATGIQIGSASEGNAIFLVRDGTATVEKITFNKPGTAVLKGVARINGGELYIGSGGIVTSGSNPDFSTTLKLAGGTLGAATDWSSAADIGVQLIGLSTIQAADLLATGHDIELAGILTGSGGFLKTGGGKLTLAGANTYTGDTTVDQGALELAATGSLKFTPTDDGVANLVSGTGTANFKGSFEIDLSGADATHGNSWQLVDTTSLTETFDASFSVTGFTEAANVWTKVDGANTWTFREDTGELSLAVSSGGGFASWIGSPVFALAPADQDPTDDPDNDGMENLLEFVLNGDPSASDPPILPSLNSSGSTFVFSFDRRDDSLSPETLLTFQYGTNLSGWTDVAVPAGSGAVGAATITVTDGDPADGISISIPKTEAGPGGKLFGRLKVTRP